jgi:hypothetical protein
MPPHTHHTAALAARAILERTSRIAKTWDEYFDTGHRATAHMAHQLACEQLHGPQVRVDQAEAQRITAAVAEVMPELFSGYWEALPA